MAVSGNYSTIQQQPKIFTRLNFCRLYRKHYNVKLLYFVLASVRKIT